MRISRRVPALVKALGWLVLALGSAAITVASAVYFDDDDLPAFVVEKLPLPLEDLWFAALRIHVVVAAFALPACLVLLWNKVLRRAPGVHRWLGRATGLVVLLILVPSGAYLSLFAKGGLPATLGFLLSGLIVVGAMVQSVRMARAGDYLSHRRHALHVLAQLSVAVTSRAMLFVLDAADVDANTAYLVSLWLPVVLSAVAVELSVPRPHPLHPSRSNHDSISALRHPARSHPGLRGATSG